MSESCSDDPLVYIRRQWNDYRVAAIALSKVQGVHWSDVSGGVRARAPRPFLHCFVLCNDYEGELAHSCLHGSGPHSIKVCIVKKDNEKAVIEQLTKLASISRN